MLFLISITFVYLIIIIFPQRAFLPGNVQLIFKVLNQILKDQDKPISYHYNNNKLSLKYLHKTYKIF